MYKAFIQYDDIDYYRSIYGNHDRSTLTHSCHSQ